MSDLSRLALRGLAVSVALAAVPAMAQSPDELVVTSSGTAPHVVTRSIAVSYDDLSLADGSGYARLSRRVADAADKVCSDNGLWSAANDLDYLRCRKNAVATAMSHMPVSPSAGN